MSSRPVSSLFVPFLTLLLTLTFLPTLTSATCTWYAAAFIDSSCSNGFQYAEGASCYASCITGSTPSGVALTTSTCTASGSFDGNGPICIPNPCDYTLPTRGLTSSCAVGSVPHGTSCQVTSCSGSYYYPEGSVTCQAGSFVGAEDCYYDPPPKPCTYTIPLNATSTCVTKKSYGVGYVCKANCTQGFTLNVPQTECINKYWDLTQTCTPSPCIGYALPSNATSSSCTVGATAKITSGTTCTAKCAANYFSFGTTSCSYGKWTTGQTCQLPPPCLNYEMPRNSILGSGNCTAGSSYGHSTNCTATCKPGALSNNGTNQCYLGKWSFGQTCFLSYLTDVKILARNATGDITSQSLSSFLVKPFNASIRSYRLNIPFGIAQIQVQPIFKNNVSLVEFGYVDVVSGMNTSVILQGSQPVLPTDYTSDWITLNEGGGDFFFNISSDVDATYSYIISVPPQNQLRVTKSPASLYVNTRSSVFIVEPVRTLQPYSLPIALNVTCTPKANCELSKSSLLLNAQANFTLIVRGISSGNVTLNFTAIDTVHTIAPVVLKVPIVPQAAMTMTGPSSVFSYADSVFSVSPSVTPIETFTVVWTIETPSPTAGTLLVNGAPADSVTQTFLIDANPAIEPPLFLSYRSPSFDVSPQLIRLVGKVTTLSNSSAAQFVNPLIEMTLKGAQTFVLCGDSKSLYVTGDVNVNTTGVYTVSDSINYRPHFVKIDSTTGMKYHLYSYINPTTQVASWIIEQINIVGAVPSVKALINTDDSAPFSAAWKQLSSNTPVGTLTVICAPDCTKVGTQDSIESSVCDPDATTCSLSCAKYLPAVTATCGSNSSSLLPSSITTRLSNLTQSCSSCNFTYVSSVMQKCGATLSSSDLTSDMSEVLAFPTLVNPLSGGSSYICSSECATAYLPFYSQCIVARTTAASTIPNAMRQFAATCLPNAPPAAISLISFFGVTTSTISMQWDVPSQLQAAPLPLTYRLEQSAGNNTNFTVVYNGTSATVPSYVATGLVAKTQYRYRVTAISSAGSSAISSVFAQTTGLAVPLPPKTLTATTPAAVTSIVPQISNSYTTTLKWSDPAGSATVTALSKNISYRVQVIDVFNVVTQVYYGPALTFVKFPLLAGTTVTVNVTCRDGTNDQNQTTSSGTVVPTAASFTGWSLPKTLLIPTSPLTVSMPKLTYAIFSPTNSSQIIIAWENVGCGSVNCTTVNAQYEVSVSIGAGAFVKYGALQAFPELDGTARTYTATIAAPLLSTVYNVQVRAYSSVGSQTSAPLSLTTPGVNTITALPVPTYAVDITQSFVSVQFTVNLAVQITQLKFTIVKNVTGAVPVDVFLLPLDLIIVTGATSKTVLPIDLLPSTNYSVQMTVRNDYGWSALRYAQNATFFTTAIPPRLLSCVASGAPSATGAFSNSTNITLTFDRPTNVPLMNTSVLADATISFTPAIGAKYTGAWSASGTILTLNMLIDTTRGTVPVFGVTQCKVFGKIKSADGTSPLSSLLAVEQIRQPLSGTFASFITGAHLLPSLEAIVVDQDAPAFQVMPTLNTQADFTATVGTVNITVTSSFGLLSSSTQTTPVRNFTASVTYASLLTSASPLTSLSYTPSYRFYGADTITITMNSTLVGSEKWNQVVIVNRINHAPIITVPIAPLNYTVEAGFTAAVGVKMVGLVIQDEDSLSASTFEVEFSHPGTAAQFALGTALSALCTPSVPLSPLLQWTPVLNIRCPYSVLSSYLNLGGVVYSNPLLDMSPLNPPLQNIKIRVLDHGSNATNAVSLSSEAYYFIRPQCVKSTAPKFVKAQLSNDLSSVVLSFDAPIFPVFAVDPLAPDDPYAVLNEVPCASLLDAATIGLIGENSLTTPLCVQTGAQKVTVTLGRNAKLTVGNNVVLNTAGTLIRRCASATLSSTGTIAVTLPDITLPKPKVHLIGPSTIGVCQTLTLEARSEQVVGVGALKYVWTSTSDPSLILPTFADQPVINIPAVLLTTGVQYNFTVRVITSLGFTSDFASLVVTRNVNTIPVLVPVSVLDTTLEIDQSLSLLAVASASSCLSGVSLADQALSFSWTVTPALTLTTNAALVSSAAYPKLQLPSNALDLGKTYDFTLTAKQKIQATLMNSITFRVVVVASSNVKTPTVQSMQEVSDAHNVTLSIPSSITTLTPGPYAWSCLLIDGSVCPDGTTNKNLVLPASSIDDVVQLPANTLVAPNTYVFSVTTVADPSRTLEVITITVQHAPPIVSDTPPMPQIVLKPSSILLSLNTPLTIVSSLRSTDGSSVQPTSNYAYVWTSSSNTWQGVASPVLQNVIDSTTGSVLSISASPTVPNIWIAGSIVTFRLTITDTVTSLSTFSEISITISTPPHSGSFDITPAYGVALNTTYMFSATGWLGYGLLKYEYYYTAVDNSQIRAGKNIGSPYDSSDVMFPGVADDYFVDITLVVTDSAGFSTSMTQQIVVQPNAVLMNDPVALNNYLQDHVQQLTNAGASDALLALVNGQSVYNSAQANARCAAIQAPYKLTWSPAPSQQTNNGNNGASGTGSASAIASTKLLIDSLTSILQADPSAASSPAVVASCKTLLNDIVTLTSITLTASLRSTCSRAVDPTSGPVSSPSLSSQFATTIALLNLNRRNTDINNGGAYTYNTVSASNRRRLLDTSSSSVSSSNQTAQSAALAASTRSLVQSLSGILDLFSTTVLQVPGHLITLPDCQMPSAVRRDLPATPIQFTFDLDNATVTYASNWLAGTTQATVPVDTRMTYSTANLYSFASNWITDKLKPLSGMMITSRTTTTAIPITQTKVNPSMWITLPFNPTLCVPTTTGGECKPKCMTFDNATLVWSPTGVATTYPSIRAVSGSDVTMFADCTISTAARTVALFASTTTPASSSSTGPSQPPTDAHHADPRELSPLGSFPPDSQLPSSPKTSAWAVNATMFLYLDSSFISSWLKTQFQKDLATAVGLPLTRVNVNSFAAGSILASFTLLPLATGPTPTQAYTSLREQLVAFLADSTVSNKLSSGALTRYSEDLRGAQYIGSSLCMDQTYQLNCDAHGGYVKDDVVTPPGPSSTGADSSSGGTSSSTSTSQSSSTTDASSSGSSTSSSTGDQSQGGDNDGSGVNNANSGSSSGLALYIIIIIAVGGGLLFFCIIIIMFIKCRNMKSAQRSRNLDKMRDGQSSMPPPGSYDGDRRGQRPESIMLQEMPGSPSAAPASSPPVSSAPPSMYPPEANEADAQWFQQQQRGSEGSDPAVPAPSN